MDYITFGASVLVFASFTVIDKLLVRRRRKVHPIPPTRDGKDRKRFKGC